MRSEYAGSLREEINRYLRFQSQQEPLSRGISKIIELVKVVRNSSYSSDKSVEQLARVAKEVAPERVSLPDKREAFMAMAERVPHGVEPPQPVKGCFKVSPQNLRAVRRKLLDAGVATLIPEHLGLRNSKGEIISGGLFVVDRKPHSDRIILDRRPFNELERRLVWAKLPPVHS